MSVTRADAIAAAKDLAQDPASGAILLLEAADYDQAVNQAIDRFSADVANRRIVHYTVVTAGFRFVLFGTGAILATSGVDKWIDGGSRLEEVYLGYDTASRDNEPIDRNHWRVIREPGPKDILELLEDSAAVGEVLRLEFVSRHQVESSAANTTIREGDVTIFETLAAAKICAMAARRYAQNTGSSGFPNDIVDRRSQSDIMASRAKDLMKEYEAYVGGAPEGATPATGFVKRMEVTPTHGRPRMWRRPV